MEEATTYTKIWKTGKNTDVITIKKEIMKLMKLKRGDTLQITIKRIRNKQEEQTIETQEEKIEEKTQKEETKEETQEEETQEKEKKTRFKLFNRRE